VIGSKGTTTFAFTYDATIRISAPA
jgi:hypothetical protein